MQWPTGLEPNNHKKDETLKAVTVTVSRVYHSTQNKWQKWRKDVLRHTPYGFGGMPLKQKQWSVSPRKNWFQRVCSTPVGIKRRRRQKHTAAIFEVKFGKKAEGVITDSRERTADTLSNGMVSVALAIEGSDLNITENNFVPTAKCIQDTKNRQLATRSGLQRLRCSVCHLHHERAMKSPLRVRQFFKTVLQQVHHFKVDVIAGDANAAAYKYFKLQEAAIPRFVHFFGCHHV